MKPIKATQSIIAKRATEFGVTISQGQLSKILNGVHTPRAKTAEGLEKATDGVIKATDWKKQSRARLRQRFNSLYITM